MGEGEPKGTDLRLARRRKNRADQALPEYSEMEDDQDEKRDGGVER